jgi:ribonuclease HII
MAVSLEYELALGGLVIGVDEAGRGPLAGGVFAGAVYVPLDLAAGLLEGAWSGINDSKKLSEKKRDSLAEVIKSTEGCIWSVASASPAEIDRVNILRATHVAMRRAAKAVYDRALESAKGDAITVLVDGLAVDGFECPSRNLVKGDAKSLLIAAASILAKTARDADCLRLEAEYPGYGFAKHKGYPTKAHLTALAKLGPCPEHRRSFGPVAQGELFELS